MVAVSSWLEFLKSCVLHACCADVAYPKPGNVHARCDLPAQLVTDFIKSANAVVPVLADSADASVGRRILESVQVTQNAVGHNTNLGIILLLAPLCAIPEHQTLATGIPDVLKRLDVADARLTYRAIAMASPGGLGRADEQSVNDVPTLPLNDCMALAADRDMIARQYATGFQDILGCGSEWFRESADFVNQEGERPGWLAMQLLSHFGDSLIARKNGLSASEDVRVRAQRVLQSGWPHSQAGRVAYQEFDTYLRSDGHRLNPGTTADLVVAILFAEMRDEKFVFQQSPVDELERRYGNVRDI